MTKLRQTTLIPTCKKPIENPLTTTSSMGAAWSTLICGPGATTCGSARRAKVYWCEAEVLVVSWDEYLCGPFYPVALWNVFAWFGEEDSSDSADECEYHQDFSCPPQKTRKCILQGWRFGTQVRDHDQELCQNTQSKGRILDLGRKKCRRSQIFVVGWSMSLLLLLLLVALADSIAARIRRSCLIKLATLILLGLEKTFCKDQKALFRLYLATAGLVAPVEEGMPPTTVVSNSSLLSKSVSLLM